MKVRFHVHDSNGQLIETTEWAEEHTRDVAVSMVSDLRKAHGPEVLISPERDRIILNPKPKMFRFDITVKSGTLMVVDGGGQHARDVSGLTLQSRAFQEVEREKVLAEVRRQFPKAIIIEREL